jgi:hypothetical protein
VARIRLYVTPTLRVSEGRIIEANGTVLSVPCLRLFGNVRLGQFSRLFPCLVDTASPLTVFPRKVWQGDATSDWEGVATDVEWLSVTAGDWLTAPSGATGHPFRCRIGRLTLTALDYAGGLLAPVSVLGQFAEEDTAFDRILTGLFASILQGRRVVLDSDLRDAWLEDR